MRVTLNFFVILGRCLIDIKFQLNHIVIHDLKIFNNCITISDKYIETDRKSL